MNVSLSLNGMTVKDSIQLENELDEIGHNYYDYPEDNLKKLVSLLSEKEISNSPFFLSKCYIQIGRIHLYKARYEDALKYLYESAEIRKKNNLWTYYGTSEEEIANLHFKLGEDSLALEHLYKSLSIKKDLGNGYYLKSLYLNIGHAHYNLDHLDSALYYYKNSLEISIAQKDTTLMAGAYSGMGDVLFYQDYNYEAIDVYRKSLDLYLKSNDTGSTAIPLFNIGSVYSYLDESDSAIFYFEEALEKAVQGGDYGYVDAIYLSLAETYTDIDQQDSAIVMFQSYIAYRNSVFEKEKTNAIIASREEYEAQYKTKEAEQQAAFEKSEKEKVQAQNASNRKTIYVLLSVVTLILGIIIYMVRNTRQKSKLKALEIDSKNQEIDALLKEQEAKSYAAMLEGQNTERERIAQDLHDRLGGTLAAVKVHFNLMDQKIEELKLENRDLFSKVNDMLSDAVQDVRRISHDLASNRLSKLGLKGALEDLAQILNTTKKLEVDFFMDDSIPGLHKKKEQEVYAILQELVSNTLKHAKATSVEMQLNKQEELLNILYEDNGVGFEMKNAEKKGLGLAGLSNRVDRLEGTVNFDSVVGRGTIVIINIPL